MSVRFPRAMGEGTDVGVLDEEGNLLESVYVDFGFIDFSGLDDFDDGGLTDFSDARRRPGIGHNQGPPLKDPSDIPPKRPDNVQRINQVAREVARNPYLTAYYFVTISESVGHWLNEKSAEIKANQDPPKSLEELHDAVFRPDKKGYDDHHIVGRWTAREGLFSDARVYNNENVVSIPRYKHEQINSWYQRPNVEFGGLTPRQYLQGKSWDEHRRVGLDAMRMFGILKP